MGIYIGFSIKEAAPYITAIVIVLLISFGGWILAKKINYAFGYEQQVKNTICESVKQEYLKIKCE